MDIKSQTVSQYAAKVIQIEVARESFHFVYMETKLKIFKRKTGLAKYIEVIEETTKEMIETFLNHKEKETIFELFNCAWILDEFIYPELILTPTIFELILNHEIKDAFGMVEYLLQKDELQNKISPIDYKEKILNNPQINTPFRKLTADKILANSINVDRILPKLDIEIMKFIVDGRKSKLLKLFNSANIIFDISLSVEKLKSVYKNHTIEYEGQLNIPSHFILVNNFNQLNEFKSEWIKYQWDNVMTRGAFFLIDAKNKILCSLKYENSYFYPSRFLERENETPKSSHDKSDDFWDIISKPENQEFFLTNYNKNSKSEVDIETII